MKKNSYHLIGVMSGTSLDGIDLAELHFFISESGKWSFKIDVAQTIAYSSVWKKTLQKAVGYHEAELEDLNARYTAYLSEVINKFITQHQILNLDAVCSHGHTILHQPDVGKTLQIGNLPILAGLINQTVVCDFRVQDVAYGGQGAPLVPIGDRMLFGNYDSCLNLGGFANVSFKHDGKRMAYDICPVNIVMNYLSEKIGFAFDDKGAIAKAGIPNAELLNQLNSLAFYCDSPPKSLGLEWVQKNILPLLDASGLSVEDQLRTFTDHVALQIASQFQEGASVLVTGGGAHNDYLLSKIKKERDVDLVVPIKELIEYKEALIFGLLGVLKLRNEPNCLASVTGAKMDHSSGEIFAP